MALLNLVHAPHPIFKQIAQPVEQFDVSLARLVDDMFETLAFEEGLGLGANMVGILQRIAIVDLQEDGAPNPLTFINPDIIWQSEEMQTFEEASLCFRGISAEVTRSKAIKIRYQDVQGAAQTLEAEGFLASVIQHEVDYLNGIIFLDHLSRLKRDRLLKKMAKYIKQN